MTALDELQSLNARHSHVTPDQALAAIKRSGGVPEDEDLAFEDEELIRQMMFQSRSKRLEEPADSDDSEPVAGKDPDMEAASTNGHAGMNDSCLRRHAVSVCYRVKYERMFEATTCRRCVSGIINVSNLSTAAVTLR